ncbi:hypothetical protein ES705_19500 [subsurface metagenome]
MVFEKVETKEIQGIKERLEKELKDRNIPSQRREEVRGLICYLNIWLEWQNNRRREYHRREIKNKAKENNQSVNQEGK